MVLDRNLNTASAPSWLLVSSSRLFHSVLVLSRCRSLLFDSRFNLIVYNRVPRPLYYSSSTAHCSTEVKMSDAHIVQLPKAVFFLKIAQIALSVLILGLSAYVVYQDSVAEITTVIGAGNSFALFTVRPIHNLLIPNIIN